MAVGANQMAILGDHTAILNLLLTASPNAQYEVSSRCEGLWAVSPATQGNGSTDLNSRH